MFVTSILIMIAFGNLINAAPRPNPDASPAPAPIPAPVPAPLSDTSFAALDFAANVFFVSGAAQFGMWIPVDGNWHETSSITCLNIQALSYGACNIPTVDEVGVLAGNGPCSFVGVNGYWETVPGSDSDGWYTVAPPQGISMIACGS